MKILIDNGHGANTPGKCSPDGSFREYAFARVIAAAVVERLRALGLDAELLVPELDDVALRRRCARVNGWCSRLGRENVLLVSVHVNAAGADGRWHAARGWSAYTSRGQTRADALADELYSQARRILPPGTLLRCDRSDGDDDQEAGFALLRGTHCAAVLTENLFQDNRRDVAFLLSEEGHRAIIDLHVAAITEFLRKGAF